MTTRPLGIVKNIVEAAGMDISYVYEDLIALNHTGLLLQFTDDEKQLLIHINADADAEELVDVLVHLTKVAEDHGMLFGKGHFYKLQEGEKETLKIDFIEGDEVKSC